MKKLIFVLLLTLGAGAAQGQVKFETKSTDAVREMAIKNGKLVFIDLYASWCPPCRMMEREVFSRKDVGDFMQQRFVAAKYDTDKPTGKELMKRYGSGAIPLYLIFDTQGELLGRIQGASAPKEFMESVQKIIDGSKRRYPPPERDAENAGRPATSEKQKSPLPQSCGRGERIEQGLDVHAKAWQGPYRRTRINNRTDYMKITPVESPGANERTIRTAGTNRLQHRIRFTEGLDPVAKTDNIPNNGHLAA